MKPNILSVTFEINAQSHKDGQFTVPNDVCIILGLDNEDMIRLVVETPGGTHLFSGEKKLSSGHEIYGPEINNFVKAGQRIRVHASRL
ncbi:hypothetical protein ACFLXB_01265 [Chloroflexota bacterium]